MTAKKEEEKTRNGKKKGAKKWGNKIEEDGPPLAPGNLVHFSHALTKKDICSWSNRLNKSLASFVANSCVPCVLFFFFAMRVASFLMCYSDFFFLASKLFFNTRRRKDDRSPSFVSEVRIFRYLFFICPGPLVVWHLICCAPVEAKELQRMKANVLPCTLRWEWIERN